MFKVNPRVSALPPHSLPPGKDKRSRRGPPAAKLDYNESVFGAAPACTEALKACVPNYYAVRDHDRLVATIAALHDVPPNRVVLAGGSDALLEALPTLACFAPRDEIVFPAPTYRRLGRMAAALGVATVKVPLDEHRVDIGALAARVGPDTKMVYIVNPHMPTGTFLQPAAIRDLLDVLPTTVLCVLDHAYADYAQGGLSLEEEGVLLARHPNVLILRTFSKYYGLAGMRVGYALAGDDAVAEGLCKLVQPAAVAQPSLLAAQAALDSREWYERNVLGPTLSARRVFTRALEQSGVPHAESQANFVYVDTAKAKVDNHALCAHLLERHAIAVRAIEDVGVRVTVGAEEHMKTLAEAIALYFAEHGVRR